MAADSPSAIRPLTREAWEQLTAFEFGPSVPEGSAEWFLVLEQPGPPRSAIYAVRYTDGIMGLGPRLAESNCEDRDLTTLWESALTWARAQGCALQVVAEVDSLDAECLERLGVAPTCQLLGMQWVGEPPLECSPPSDIKLVESPYAAGPIPSLIARTWEESLDVPESLAQRVPEQLLAEWQSPAGDAPPAEIWTGEVAGQLVGLLTVRLEPERVVIVYLGVAREYRRQGWGRRLLEVATTRVPLGQPLVVHVDHRNQPAMALYRGMGFVEFDRVWFRTEWSDSGG